MASDSNVRLAKHKSIKSNADTMLPLAGGAMTGNVDLGVNVIPNVVSFDERKFM